MSELTDKDMACLRAYADSRMRGNAAAKSLYIARGTLDYHLNLVYVKTGLNPRDFYDLAKLIDAMNEGEQPVD